MLDRLDEHKAFYYRALERYGEEPGLLPDTFRTMQDACCARFVQFVELNPGRS